MVHLEVRRQIAHLIIGMTFVLLLFLNILSVERLLWIFAFCFIISLMIVAGHRGFFYDLIKLFERKKDLEYLPLRSPLMMIIGSALVVALFPKNVALASITILALGDSISHLVGRFYGKMPHPLDMNKNVEGIIAGTFAGFLGAMLFVNPIEAFIAAVFAMMFEAVELEIWHKTSIDDNIIVPLIAGITIMLFRIL